MTLNQFHGTGLFLWTLKTQKTSGFLLHFRGYRKRKGILKQYISRMLISILTRNKHEYQHSADIFVKNIFNLFHGSIYFQ